MAPSAPAPALRPGVGFCLQTDSRASPAARWYLNFCKHTLIEMPVAYSGKTVDKNFLLRQGLAGLQVPFDLGSFRKLKERSDGSRHTTYCVDVVFNPFIVQLFMDDDFNAAMVQYRPWIVDLVVRRVEESIGVKLSTTVKLMKAYRYKDFDGDLPREFAEITNAHDEDAEKKEDKPASKVPEAPLIEELSSSSKPRKQALKKGFLKGSQGALYGEEGSKEGVLPENAGDPLGYLPKKLRNSCKVVDCNSPEYQKSQADQKAAEKSNDMNSEFKSMLDKWGKASTPDKWEADMPDGTSEPLKCKYDNDYSRFDSIEEEEEVKAPVADDRDWYFDSKGNPCKLDRRQPQATGSPHTDEQPADRQPAVQKGFLDKAKSSIYGSEGSSQAKAAPSDDDMLKQLGKLMGGADSEKLNALLGGGDSAERKSPKPSGDDMMKELGNLMSGMSGKSPSSPGDDMMKELSKMMGGKTPDSSGDDMMKELSKMIGGDADQFSKLLADGNVAELGKAMGLGSDEVQRAMDALNLGPEAGARSSVPTASAPKYELSEEAEGLRLVVGVPGLTSMKGVNLDVTDSTASIDFPTAGLAPLRLDLPRKVDPATVRAKFSKKTQQLMVTLPVV